MGLGDSLDQKLDFLGLGIQDFVVEDLGFLDDGDGIVGRAGARVQLARRAAESEPGGEQRHPGECAVLGLTSRNVWWLMAGMT